MRLCGKVIAEQRCFRREPVTGQLHAVAGVPGETNDNFLELLALGRGHPPGVHLVGRTGPVAVRAHNPCLPCCSSDVFLSRGLIAPSGSTSIKLAVTPSTD